MYYFRGSGSRQVQAGREKGSQDSVQFEGLSKLVLGLLLLTD